MQTGTREWGDGSAATAALTREEMDEVYGVLRMDEEADEWPRPRECRKRMPNGDPASADLWGVDEG